MTDLMKRLRRAACCAAALLLAAQAAAAAPHIVFPRFTGAVHDEVAMLSPQRRDALDAKLKAYRERSGNRVVVAIVPDLQGRPIDDFANQLFRHWKLGEKNHGVLFLIAKAGHHTRIEVGYELEPVLTDAASHLILANDVRPAFKQGRFDDGITAGVDDIIQTLSPAPAGTPQQAIGAAGQNVAAAAPADNEQAADPAEPSRIPYTGLVIFFGIVGGVLFLGFRARRRQGKHGRRSSGASDSSWESSSSDSSSDSSPDSSSDSSGDGGSSGGGGASDSW